MKDTMAEFDLNEYLNRRNNGFVPSKLEDIVQAREQKIADMQRIRDAAAENAQQVALDEAIRGGRGTGEFLKDVALSGVQGIDALAKLPAMAYDKATTGDWYGAETQKISAMSDEREKLKSSFAQAKNQQKMVAAQTAGQTASEFAGGGLTGAASQVAAEFGVSLWEAAKDPGSIPEFLAQQAAQLGVMGKVGRGADIVAQSAAKISPRLVATKAGEIALAKAGTGAAVGTGAVLQGTDSGSDTMQRLMTLPDEVWDQNQEYNALKAEVGPEQAKQTISSRLASEATVKAAAASVASSFVPGGNALEKGLIGKQKIGLSTIPKAYAGEFTQEGIEEGTGQAFGNQAVSEINPAQSLTENVGFAAGQGAFMGGLMGGGLNAVQTAANNISLKKSDAGTPEKSPEQVDAIKAAIASGDVSAFTDPKSPSYSPIDAVQALYGNSQLADVTPEAKQANLEKASQIVNDLQAKKEELEQAYSTVSSQGVATLKAKLAAAQAEGNAAKVALLTTMVADAESDTEAAPRFERQLKQINEQIASANTALTNFNQELQPADFDVAAEASKIDGTDVAASQASADKIINLSMAIPERLDEKTASALADDQKNGLTAPQRTYLRTFSKARQAENALMNMEGVSKEIYLGNEQRAMVGIKDYRANVTTAVASGNRNMADKELAQLGRFVADHTQKADLMAEALATGKPHRLISDGNGGWSIEPGEWESAEARTTNGGLDINRTSSKLAKNTRTEADALVSAEAELRAAYDLKFNPTQSSEVSDVKNVSEAPAQVEDAAPVSEAPAETEAGTTTDRGDTGTGETDSDVQRSENTGVAEETTVAEEAPASSVTTEITEEVQGQLQSTDEQGTEGTTNVEVAVKESGELVATKETTPEGTAHNQKKFGDFFTQSAGRDTDGSKRPLVAVKDFLTQLANQTIQLGDYLKSDALTDAQRGAIEKFKAMAKQWAPVITRNLKPTHNPLFNYEDPMRYLISMVETDGKSVADVEENLKTAISAAVFAFIGDQAGRSNINDNKAINAILGRQSDTPVSNEARKALQEIGTYQSAMADSLGTKVMDALGFKLRTDVNAPQDMLAKLHAALGAHALKLMEDAKLVKRDTVPAAVITGLRNEGNEEQDAPVVNENAKDHVFFKLDVKSTEVSTAVRGSKNVIQNLFGIESSARAPSEEPIKKVQQTSDTGMGVASLLKRVFKQKQTKDKWFLVQDRMKVLGEFSTEEALEMGGKVEISDTAVHARNQRSQQAKNDGITRQFNQFMDWVGERTASGLGFDDGFFYTPDMWKQQRAGLRETIGNPQTNKLARQLVAPKEWDTEIARDNAGQMQSFKLRVAEGLGRKTEKGESVQSAAWLDAKMKEPMMVAAIKALQQSVFTETALSAEQKQAVMAAVKAGGEKFHTLSALIAYANYQQAVDTKADAFTTNLMGEVDGVSNGSILNHILYGAAASAEALNKLLERGGIYTANSIAQKYSEWYGKGSENNDIYEHNAKLVDEVIIKATKGNGSMATTVAAIWATSKVPVDEDGNVTKGGRNLMKTALNPLNYGSGFKKIKQNMAAAYVDGIYAQFEEISKQFAQAKQEGNDAGMLAAQAALNAFVGNLNIMLENRAAMLPVGRPIAYYMGRELTKAQTAVLEDEYTTTVGEATVNVIKETFGPLMKKTRLLTNTTQLTYDLYNAVYMAKRVELIKELGIPIDKGQPIHDLSVEQEKELSLRLADIAPVMHTAMSADDANLFNGISLAKQERGPVNRENYMVRIGFGSPLANGAKQMTVRGQGRQQAAPGVMAISGTTQALDSANSHMAQEGRNILNIHDAIGDGIGGLAGSAEAINKATFTNVMEYSPMSAAHESLMRVVRGLVAMEQAGALTPEAKKNIQSLLKAYEKRSKGDIPAAMVVELAVRDVFNASVEADRIKYESASKWTAMDQYAFDGGSYVITDADREYALKKFNSVTPEMTPASEEALTAFMKLIGANRQAEVVNTPAASKPSIMTAFGETGYSSIPSALGLVQYFIANPDVAASDVISALGSGNTLSAADQRILALVSRTLKASNSNLRIRYVTPETDPATLLALPKEPSRAWFVAKGTGQSEIYVLSPQFKNSGLTPEVLMHELVHAAVAAAIDNPTKEGAELVAELEVLRTKAAEYVKANNITGYAAALGSVQELVAWGMTNLDFQKNVLAKVKMKSRTTGNPLVSGMQKFIESLVVLLGGRYNQTINDGVTILVSNVSGLFAQAAQTTAPGTELNLSMAAEQDVDSYTTLDIHRALADGRVSPVFQDHLANLLGGIVEALHGPHGALAASMRKDEAGTPMAIWLKSLSTGKAPFASAIVASNFAGSAQEDFTSQQVELTVKAALDGNEATTKPVYKELYKLYTEARATLKPTDFDSQEDYDFVFKMESDNGDRSDYLARFAALGLANEKFNGMLKFNTAGDTSNQNKTLFDRLVQVYEAIMSMLGERVNNVFGGQKADEKLEVLIGQLVDVEAKKRHAVELRKDGNRFIAPIERGVKTATDTLREKAVSALNSDIVKDSSSATVRAAGTLARAVAGGYVDKYLEQQRKVRDVLFDEKDGVVASVLNELKGPLQKFNELLREVKHRENVRKKMITEHASMASKAYLDGETFTIEQSASITAVFMRSGLHNLLGDFTLAQIEKMLSNRGELTTAIDAAKAKLTGRIKNHYIEQANALGLYKATGKNALDGVLMFNAHAISRMAGTQFTGQITQEEASQNEAAIASLVSLYALRYTDTTVLQSASQILRTEMARTDGENGVEFTLQLHKQLEAQSLVKLFKGNPMLMEHGYTPDIVNPHTSITTADEQEGKNLIAQGYRKGAAVSTDPANPDRAPRHIYVLRDGGLSPWLSGILSLTSMQAKGSAVHNGYTDVRNTVGLENAQLQAQITDKKLGNMNVVMDPGRDLSQIKKSSLAPIYNEMGDIVNWRHLMQGTTKDSLLERDNRFDQLLGTLAGSIYDKVSSQEQNEQAITALREQYQLDNAINGEAYIEVGSRSSDPDMRELWNMLPDGTRKAVRKIWGRDGMKVRKDSLDMFFGYRKLSAADFLRKERSALVGVQAIARNMFHLYATSSRGMNDKDADNFAKRMGVALTKGERGWQEIVHAIKDIVVVKNIFTLLGNIYSNDSLLFLKGVENRWHHQLVAIKGVQDYQEHSRALMDLQTKLELGYTQGKDAEMQREVVRLKDLIDRNPVKALIDAGLMPTIVEDVASEEDIYSYKSWAQRKTEGFTNRVPEGVRTVGKNIFFTHDTKAYQFLSKSTQMSDFVARYALYQHLTTRAVDPLSHADAVEEASDSFVNYDNPMHRSIQYTDDMGITPFTKYFLRIQRVLMKTLRENPARVLSLLALGQLMDLGPIVLESAWVAHLGNSPVRSGAFQAFDAVTELPAIAGAMAIVK